MRSERGQTAAEYLGVLLVISVIIAAVATTTVGAQIGESMHKLVCNIAGQDCGAPPENAAQVDSDGDGVLDGDDPVPNHSDIDGDGLSDGEEIALGSDPEVADTRRRRRVRRRGVRGRHRPDAAASCRSPRRTR